MGSQWSSNFGSADALRQAEKDFRPVEVLKIYCHLKVIEMKNKSTASLNTETTVCLLSQLIRDEMLRR